MQTFLPYPDYEKSAAALDYRRLGSQINEVQTIAGYLLEIHQGNYRTHPAVQAWEGCTMQLITFGLVCEDEWESRGYKRRTNRAKLEWMLTCAAEDENTERPVWFGHEPLHLQYQGLLVFKDPSLYGPVFPGVTAVHPDDFVWPLDFNLG